MFLAPSQTQFKLVFVFCYTFVSKVCHNRNSDEMTTPLGTLESQAIHLDVQN